MEQMLTTGGGWQDQIGGVAGGVKYAVSPPGLRPDLAVYQLDPWLFEAPEAVGRYTLFYTGATRLARNILQEVVDGFNSMDPASLFTVRRIGALADAAREAFSLRDIDRLARVIRESWKQNRLIHPSTTNAEIDAMLAARLREALGGVAQAGDNERARVVDLSLNREGLQVTVS